MSYHDDISKMQREFGHGSDFEYWAYQIPVIGNIARANDNAKFWRDYERNTGYRPRYPGRSYNPTGMVESIVSAGRAYGRAVESAYW